MHYFLPTLTVVLMSVQNITTKQYTKKRAVPNTLIFVAVAVFFAMLFFLVASGFRLRFNSAILPYAIGFAVTYATAAAGNNFAIRTGPLSLTSLILSYSLVIPTLYGILFLDERIHLLSYVGIALLLLSLVLINFKKEKMIFTPAWIVFVTLAFFGNGLCSAIQKAQQLRFNGNYKNEFMIVSLLIVCVCLFCMGVVRSKKDTAKEVWHTLPYAPLQGLANGAVNLLVMILSGILPNALLFPVISAGGIVCTFFISIYIYKETLSKAQTIGFALGVLSVVLLNL